MLLVNNVDSAVPLSPGNDNAMVDPTIPTQGMFKPDGAALKAALMNSPQTAHLTGVTGVERDGTIGSVFATQEAPMGLTEAATDAVRRWVYAPARLEGRPIAVVKTVRVRFALPAP